MAFNNLDLTFQRPNNKTINRIQLKPLRTFRVSRRMCSVVYWGHFITLHFVQNISQHFVVEMFVETMRLHSAHLLVALVVSSHYWGLTSGQTLPRSSFSPASYLLARSHSWQSVGGGESLAGQEEVRPGVCLPVTFSRSGASYSAGGDWWTVFTSLRHYI